MDLVNLGTPELLTLIFLGLVLFGPEDMVRWARRLGSFVGRLRRLWDESAPGLSEIVVPTEETKAADEAAEPWLITS